MIYTIDEIKIIVSSVACKYKIQSVFLFGSYARGEATEESDLDFFIIGKPDFKLSQTLAFAEDLREAFHKDVDVFEIREIIPNTEFSRNLMKDRRRVA
ncbi:MAG: nucleotidyltransferase domain-containing protein [Lachnospiraceae bacterium]|nr:nucleotidyltransferase domain-containing protein [Lachnospiraceae bacterium]